MRIDSHQHFWTFDLHRHSWITEDMSVIRRDFLPKDLQPILQRNAVDGCVAVQVDHSEEDTEFLLDLAGKEGFIKGVVGWIDLRSDQVADRIATFSSHRKLRGFRHILQGEPKGFMTDSRFVDGVNTVCKAGFTYDLLIYHHQFAEALEFLKATEQCSIVIDHLGKPAIRDKEITQWTQDVHAASSFKNVYCKLSGMVTEADWKHWTREDLFPYMDVIFEKFGARRIMYGSDWPVCLVAAGYEDQLGVVLEYISRLSVEEQNDVMGGNAMRFYNLV